MPADLKLSLLGRHQLDNAAAAITAADVLKEQGWQITQDSLLRGLQQTTLPGRMQVRLFSCFGLAPSASDVLCITQAVSHCLCMVYALLTSALH